MWIIKNSKGQFERVHGAATPADPTASHLLGEPNATASRGNFELLDSLIRSVDVGGTTGSRHSERVYCGLTTAYGSAESDSAKKGAWVSVSAGFVGLLEEVSAVALAFPQIMRETVQVETRLGTHAALDFLGNIRTSAFLHLKMEGEQGDLAMRAPDIWDEHLRDKRCAELVESALLWTVSHELAHLTQGDCGIRVDEPLRAARMIEASTLPGGWWPADRAHQDELLADRTAIDIAAASSHRAGRLSTLMSGSMIAVIATALDGWNLDRSSPSVTHPAPFFRAECLAVYWCNFLAEQDGSARPARMPPDARDLEAFAQMWVMAGWLAGRYRDGRDGLGLFDDANQMWGFLLSSSGHVGPFANSWAGAGQRTDGFAGAP